MVFSAPSAPVPAAPFRPPMVDEALVGGIYAKNFDGPTTYRWRDISVCGSTRRQRWGIYGQNSGVADVPEVVY